MKISYLLLFTVLLGLCIPCFAQRNKKYDAEGHFFEHKDTLALFGNSFNGLEKLDDVVDQYKIFLTGENHAFTASNARLWLKMIKYLHQKAGVRNIVFEYGFSYGWLVNEYLQTGDMELYHSIKNFAYPEYSEAIKELREYNASLDKDNKLYLCAIDIERGIYPIVKLLNYLIPDDKVPHDSIVLHIQSLHSLASYNDSKLYEQGEGGDYINFNFKSNPTLELVRKNFDVHTAHYEELLGDEYELFRQVIVDHYNARRLWLTYDAEKAVQEYIFRENYMYQRFMDEQAKHEGKWFGQFGRCHTTLSKQINNSCDWHMFHSLANRIKHSSKEEYMDSVMTIGVIYRDDRNMGKYKLKFENEFEKYFSEMPTTGVILFDFSKDTILDSLLSVDFNYLFLSTYTRTGSLYKNYIETPGVSNVKNHSKFILSLSEKSFDFGELNGVFSDPSITGQFENLFQIWDISFLVSGPDKSGLYRLVSGVSAGFSQTQIISSNSNIQFELTEFYYKNQFYYNITPRIRFLDIMPGIGLGYEQLKLTVQENVGPVNNISQGFLGNGKYSKYFNPGIVADIALIMDINLTRFSLGILTGYSKDFSNTSWRANRRSLAGSPKTALSGVYNHLRLGFNF